MLTLSLFIMLLYTCNKIEINKILFILTKMYRSQNRSFGAHQLLYKPSLMLFLVAQPFDVCLRDTFEPGKNISCYTRYVTGRDFTIIFIIDLGKIGFRV